MVSLLALLATPAAAAPPDTAVVAALADRILQCCDEPTGAIFLQPPAEARPGGLVPYFAHFGAYGLLRAYEVTAEPQYLRAADRWIAWYAAHQRPDGTVTDYDLQDDGTLIPTGDMDSTDSYAAMYLWVVAERRRVAPLPEGWLREHELSCYGALSAILLTMQDDGLTIAKPDYPIEYAMDNTEVIVGLRSAGLIFDALGNPGVAGHVRRLADRAETELRTFYDAEHGHFAWYRDLAGERGFALEKWYPDVMAQVLLLMRIGRPEEPDRSVWARVVRDHLVREFDPARPAEHVWYGLAAQRVQDEEWGRKLVAPLNELTAEHIAAFDALRCSSVLEAITGGTRP